jgi:Secretion system C-terminal sorting domain
MLSSIYSKLFSHFALLLFFIFSFFTTKITAQTCNLLSENFDALTISTLPSTWLTNSVFLGTSPAPHSGTQFLGMNAVADSVVFQAFDCPGELRFWWRASGGTSDWDVKTYYSQNAGTTWTQTDVISTTGSSSPTAYTQRIIDLPETSFTTGSQILIKMKMTRRVAGSFYMDDLCISKGVCAMDLAFANYAFSCVETNQPITFTVCKQDVAGTTDNAFTGAIAITKQSGAGSVTGTLTRNAVAGCATFNDIKMSASGNYVLTATSGALTKNTKTIVVTGSCAFSSIKVMSYNLLNFPNGRNDCGAANLVIPNRQDTLKKITDYIQPDALLVCELQTLAGSNAILNQTLNSGGVTSWRAANFVLNTSPGGTVLNNMFYYNSNKMTLYKQHIIPTDVRDISLYTVFLNDPNLAAHHDTTFVDFYVAHLKAGTAGSDTVSRNYQCLQLRNYIAAHPNRNAFFGGDFNFYNSTQVAYQHLLTAATPFMDPLNRPGAWEGNAAFADIHTQTTRALGIDMDCGATGGMDSRLDFLLTSAPAITGTQHLTYRPASYKNVGNNGTTLNKSINNIANTSSVPRSVLNALFYMSDHVPIVLDADIAFPSPPPTTLPVKLTAFSVSENRKNALLKWHAETEINAEKYVIERSLNGSDFKAIAEIKALNTNNSDYDYTDTQPLAMNYYRLKMVDFDGKTDYSSIKTARFGDIPLLLYPNPVTNTLYLDSEANEESTAKIVLYNMLGSLVFEKEIELQKGKNTTILPLDLPEGRYIIRLQNGAMVQQGVFIKM